jgi:hypothetical protein
MGYHKPIRLDDKASSRFVSKHRNRRFNFRLTMNGRYCRCDVKGSRRSLE